MVFLPKGRLAPRGMSLVVPSSAHEAQSPQEGMRRNARYAVDREAHLQGDSSGEFTPAHRIRPRRRSRKRVHGGFESPGARTPRQKNRGSSSVKASISRPRPSRGSRFLLEQLPTWAPQGASKRRKSLQIEAEEESCKRPLTREGGAHILRALQEQALRKKVS